ncbi:hypothetical protein APS56_00980 [Pseudalgibacter alginicilyticus]|uniref:LamG-like jellyroll fold domain-containing protein n=2 Tax=Pseudalgibacter alginicilyticus TaxID=1736674 RepID=A0A0P0CD65_9FLAO|nr:hypothetical protein APS56_00980 [Pseudalgibacter alginicilyticus]
MFTLVTNAQDDYVLQFDASNSQRLRYLTTEHDVLDTKLNGATDYTIEVWVKPTSTEINNTVVLKRWNQFAITLYQDDKKRFYFTHYSASGNKFVNSQYNVININEWNHLVVICNSNTNSIKLFANGVEVTGDSLGNPTTEGALALETSPIGTNNFYIGASGSGTSYFTGQVDKIRVKNEALNIGDLQSDITDADYIADSNTAILYNFNEGAGLIAVNEADSQNASLQCSSNDCISGETWWVNLSETLSTKKISETGGFSLYPNPTENKSFTIETTNNESIQQIEIYDALGKRVNKTAFKENTLLVHLGVEFLKSGIYIVKTKTNKGISIKKLIVK